VSEYLGPENTWRKQNNQVAIVPVFGVLSHRSYCDNFWGELYEGYDSIIGKLSSALQCPDIRAALLWVDSPGGDVAGLTEAVREMVRIRDGSSKPIAAYVDEMACSAAYEIAACVSNAGVYCPGSAIVGSIGVYTELYDNTKANENYGRVVKLVREPSGKAENHPDDPIPELALSRAREQLRQYADDFYATVSASRNISVETIKGFEGATFVGERAVNTGLVDGICSFDDAVRKVFELANELRVGSKTSARVKEKAMANSKTNGLHNTQQRSKALDSPDASESDAGSGGVTYADFADVVTECEAICARAKTAVTEGTPDEARAIVAETVAAAERVVEVGRSLDGSAGSSEVDPPIENSPGDTGSNAAILKELAKLRSEVAKNSVQAKSAYQQSENAERERLLANKVVSKKDRDVLKAMPMDQFRQAVQLLRSKNNGEMAADLNVVPTRGKPKGENPHGLTRREIQICKETGCPHEAYANHKREMDAIAYAASNFDDLDEGEDFNG